MSFNKIISQNFSNPTQPYDIFSINRVTEFSGILQIDIIENFRGRLKYYFLDKYFIQRFLGFQFDCVFLNNKILYFIDLY